MAYIIFWFLLLKSEVFFTNFATFAINCGYLSFSSDFQRTTYVYIGKCSTYDDGNAVHLMIACNSPPTRHRSSVFSFFIMYFCYTAPKGTIMEIRSAWPFDAIPATVIRGIYLHLFNTKCCIVSILFYKTCKYLLWKMIHTYCI